MSLNRQEQAKEALAQKLYAATKDPLLVQPARYVPIGLYSGNAMHSPRAGANDRIHASVPMRAQITRSQA